MILRKDNPAYAVLWSVFRKFDKEGVRSELLDFYLKLEKEAEILFQKGLLKEGDSFVVPAEMNFCFRFEFFKDATAIHVKREEGKEETVLSKEDSWRKEYVQLRGFEQACKMSGFGIGSPYTKEFERFVASMSVGQIVTFEDGDSFVCVSNNGTSPVLQKTFAGDLAIVDIGKAMIERPFRIKNRIDMQRFYAQNKKIYTDGTISRTFPIYRAQEEINRLVGTLGKGSSKVVSIGPVSLMVCRGKNGEFAWYDNNGTQINEDKIKYLIGFFETAPVKTEYIRKKPNARKVFVDEVFAKKIEARMTSGDYNKAFEDICRYVVLNKQDLAINMSSFVKDDNGEYKAVTYAFKEENGKCHVVEVSHKDNDFSKPVDFIRDVTEYDFLLFCEKKYEKECRIMINETVKRMDELYGEKKELKTKEEKRVNENRRKIAENMVAKAPPRLMTAEEISIMEKEVDEALESYFTLREKEQMTVDELVEAILPEITQDYGRN